MPISKKSPVKRKSSSKKSPVKRTTSVKRTSSKKSVLNKRNAAIIAAILGSAGVATGAGLAYRNRDSIRASKDKAVREMGMKFPSGPSIFDKYNPVKYYIDQRKAAKKFDDFLKSKKEAEQKEAERESLRYLTSKF